MPCFCERIVALLGLHVEDMTRFLLVTVSRLCRDLPNLAALAGLDGAHLAPLGVPMIGSSESPSSSAVTSVYSAEAASLTGVLSSEVIASGKGSAGPSAAPLSSDSGGKRAAAFTGERCVGDRPGEGVAAHA